MKFNPYEPFGPTDPLHPFWELDDIEKQIVTMEFYVRAVVRNDLATILAFHERGGLSVNATGIFSGKTGLHLTAPFGRDEVYYYFLNHPDLNPWIADFAGRTADQAAEGGGRWDRAQEIRAVMQKVRGPIPNP